MKAFASQYLYRGTLLTLSSVMALIVGLNTNSTLLEGDTSKGPLPENKAPSVTSLIDMMPLLSAHQEMVNNTPTPQLKKDPISEETAWGLPVSQSPSKPEPIDDHFSAGEVIEDSTKLGRLNVNGWTADSVRLLLVQGLVVYEVRSKLMGTYIVRPNSASGFSVNPAQSVKGLSQIEVQKDVYLVHGPKEIETALRLGSRAHTVETVVLVFTQAAVASQLKNHAENEDLSLCIEVVEGTASVSKCSEQSKHSG